LILKLGKKWIYLRPWWRQRIRPWSCPFWGWKTFGCVQSLAFDWQLHDWL